MTNLQGCHIGRIIIGIFVGAFALQVLLCLLSIAVASGTGYSIFTACYHIFCWPIYFICLVLAFLKAVLTWLKKCCKGSCEDKSCDS